MSSPIQIQADPMSSDMCTFRVDRPLYKKASAYFATRESAKGSPLAEKIFEIPQIINVLVSHDSVRVAKQGEDDWQMIAKQIGQIIREKLQSGEPIISPDIDKMFPPEDELKSKLHDLIQKMINPAIANHGGFVELMDVKKNVVFIRMGGGCQGCSQSKLTLKFGVERAIREHISIVGDIIDVTDHTAGQNPYY